MNKNLNNLLLFTALSLALYSCGSSAETTVDEEPGWILNPSSEFSDTMYLMAVGSGEDLQSAQNNALANLSGRFLSEIEAEQNLYEENVREIGGDGDATETFTSQMVNTTNIEVGQDLENTEYLDSHFSQRENVYYVLAALNRQETRRLLASEMQRNNERINRRHEEFQQSGEIHRKLGNAVRNENLIFANMELLRQKEILSNTPVDDSPYRYGDKLSQYENFLDETTFQSESNAHSAINSAVADHLNRNGFSLSEDQGAIIVEIDEQINETDLDRDDAEFVDWHLQIDFYSQSSSGRYHLETLAFNGRSGALSVVEAENSARRDMVNRLNDEFTNFLQTEIFQ